MLPPAPRPWPLALTAGFLLTQGFLSLVGTLLSLAQHRLSIDLTLASLLLGYGVWRRNGFLRKLTLAALAAQILMCAWVLSAALRGEALPAGGHLFSYILFDPPVKAMADLMAAMILVLAVQLIYLARPATRRLFEAGSPA